MEKEFAVFFKKNYNDLFVFALHILDDEEQSKDVVMESFEYVWQNFGAKEEKVWKSFMLIQIRNHCIDLKRRQGVHEKYADLVIATTDYIDSDPQEEDERMEKIRSAMATLTPRTQEVLKACYIERKKYKEVADELDVSVSAIRKHIVKALKSIREIVTNC